MSLAGCWNYCYNSESRVIYVLIGGGLMLQLRGNLPIDPPRYHSCMRWYLVSEQFCVCFQQCPDWLWNLLTICFAYPS